MRHIVTYDSAKNDLNLVSCGHVTLKEALSVCPSIGPSVCPWARVKQWENAHIRPCPPVRNWRLCIRPCFFSRMHATLQPAMSVSRSVGASVTVCFSGIYGPSLKYCSCPNVWVSIFITASAHPHMTSVAVYPALFFVILLLFCRRLHQNIFCRLQCFDWKVALSIPNSKMLGSSVFSEMRLFPLNAITVWTHIHGLQLSHKGVSEASPWA